MLKDVFLSFSIPAWVFFILIWFFIGAAAWVYRRTLPPLSRFRRLFLAALRGLTLTLVLFLLLQPVLHFLYQSRQPPAVGVLLDNSASMTIQDHYGRRADSLTFILAQPALDTLADSLRLEFYRFAADLRRWDRGGDLDFAGRQTNIAAALQGATDSLSGRNLQALILISDGQYNQGASPLRFASRSAVPVYTVTIGDSLPPEDVKISGVQVNRVTYAGQTVPVKIRLMNEGFGGRQVYVRLWQGKRVLSTRKVPLARSGFEQTVALSFPAEKPGEFQYRVEVSPLKGESTRQNNVSHFVIRVLKSKLQVLLLSGQPTFDQHLIVFALHQLPEIELTVRSQTAAGGYYEGDLRSARPDSQDVFLLLGYPDRVTRPADWQKISSLITGRHKPLFLLLTRESDSRKLRVLRPVLPAEVPPRLNYREDAMAALTPGGVLHPVTRLADDPARVRFLWSDLPPVGLLNGRLRPADGTRTLVTARFPGEDRGYPLLMASLRRDVKALLCAATDIGEWHLQLQDDEAREEFFRLFMEHSLKWLVNREDIRRVQIRPQRRILRNGEPVSFEGDIMDEFYRPVRDAEAEITLTGPGEFRQKDVIPFRGDRYFYQLSGLPPGDYQYRITARRGDQVLGTRQGKIVVEPLELELQAPQANPGLMRDIARLSGGRNWSAAQFVRQAASLRFPRKVKLNDREYVIWNHLYWLIVLILLLSVEWFFRKRWGLL